MQEVRRFLDGFALVQRFAVLMKSCVVVALWAALLSDGADAFEDGREPAIFVPTSSNSTTPPGLLTQHEVNHHHRHSPELGTATDRISDIGPVSDGRRKISRKYRVDHTRGRRIGVQMAIFRLMIGKYAKECELSKKATKKLVRLFEENPPKIPTKDEDRSGWTDAQWMEERHKQRDYMKRMRALAFKRVNEHEALSRFFSRLETHDDRLRQDVEQQTRLDLRRLAKAAKVSDVDFNRFMRIRQANQAKIHWRINMHPNEIKKAENATAESWSRTKQQVLTETPPEQRQHMEHFISDVESAWKNTQQRFTSQQNRTQQVKGIFVKFLHRRGQQATSERPEDAQTVLQ